MNQTHKRLVVYTVLTGVKEPLGNPLSTLPTNASSDLAIDFICFTDNRLLKSEVWRMRYIDDIPLPSEKLSRRPKALPHEYLQDWEYSLYIDNIVEFKRLPCEADLAHTGSYLFKVFKHATRSNPRQEAEAIIQLSYEKVDKLCEQMDFYERQFPLESITPLSTCTVILRQHKHPALIKHGVTWWEQILNFGKRDQMSFDFAAKWSRTLPSHFPGFKHDSDLIQFTANVKPDRVHASFDPVKYAWMHRQDPEARKNPRQHYLDHGRHSGQEYKEQAELLEYLCRLIGSSLGRASAPRRNVAASLQDLLKSRRGQPGRLLFVRVNAAQETASFSPDEFDKAERTLGTFLNTHAAVRLALDSVQLGQAELALNANEGPFNVVLILGLPGHLLERVAKLLKQVLPSEHAIFCALCSSSCASQEIAKAEQVLAAGLAAGTAVQSMIQGSHHDSLNQDLSNSLVAFHW